ncbi:MAG: N4-gp56 family major capsid protein [Fusobacteriaceae bacterium]
MGQRAIPTPGSAGFPDVAAKRGQMIYNNPHWAVSGGNVTQADKSSIGEQIRLDIFIKQALVDIVDERYFSQLSGVYNLQKHSGKTIKKFHQIPLLDDRNANNQGIDSTGANGANSTNPTGNLYGSSKDFNAVQRGAPGLTEIGGRVNRVGFSRQIIEGTVHRLGFFYEFTNEALSFDNDSELLRHMGFEAIRGAQLIQEDMIAQDLIQSAGHVYLAGTHSTEATMEAADLISYQDLQRMAIALKMSKAPNKLKASRGSTIIDSKIIGSGYALYIPYELEMYFRDMKDNDNQPAFINVARYATGTNTLHGEIGTIGQFRIISIPRMPRWNGIGAEIVAGAGTQVYSSKGRAVANGGYGANTDTTKDYMDVFPVVAMATEAFTCLGFQADMGGKGNFKMITKMPGAEMANAIDPYGESGFTSMKWTHGMLVERPEWIAVIKSAATV